MFILKYISLHSQNGWGCEEALEVIWSNLPAWAQSLAQNHVQTAFISLQGWQLHNLSGQPVQVLGKLHNEKVFPDI